VVFKQGEFVMTEDERKQLAFISGMLLKVLTGQQVSENEIQSLDNITSDLGFWNLDEKEFRW
jgi:hypothetical protein